MSAVDELLRLYHRDGELTPPQVVKEASKPGSPLHSHFEWDDAEAGYRYRLVQAAELIRKAEVRITVDDGGSVRVRAFPHVGGYKDVAEVMGNRSMREELFEQLRRDVDVMIQRYHRYEEVAPLLGMLREWVDRHSVAA